MFLGFNCLMQSVRIPAARHNTSGKLIDNHNLSLSGNHIVLIFEHQVVSPQGKNNIVLYFKILRISQIINMEEFLHFFYAVFGQIDGFFLFIDDEVSGLLNLFSHNRIHFGEFSACFTALQLTGKNIAGLIQLCRLAALAGNNQRRSGLIDQNRVNLVDDGKMKSSLYKLLLVNNHIIPQVVKSQLVVCHISNIAVISCAAFRLIHAVQHNAHSKPKEFVYFSHPFSVTFCQIIIDSDDMNAVPFQSVQICRKSRHKSLSFSCLHLGNSSLMKNNSADQLYSVVTHAQTPEGRFADSRIRFRQKIIQRFSFFQAFLKFSCLSSEFFIRQRLHLRLQCLYPVYNGIDSLQFIFTVGSENFLYNTHIQQ